MAPLAAKFSEITTARLRSAAKLALWGVVINALFASIKISAGVFGHCYALIADGLESTLDIFSSLVIWGGLVVAARPPDATHPYGHGKAEPLAAVAVAAMVLLAAAALGIQSIRQIFTPHLSPEPYTLIILIVVIVVKALLFRKVSNMAETIGSSAVKADAWHHRADALTSLTAFIGISIAVVGGRGYETADDWAALFACGLIAFNGWRILMPALNETIDVAPPPEVEAGVRKAAAQVPGVATIEQCRVRKMGLDFYVDLHAEVDGELTVRAGHDIAHAIRDAIREDNPLVVDVLVHIEPDGEGAGD